MERRLKSLLLFCTKNVAATIISVTVTAALPIVVGLLWHGQKRSEPGSPPVAGAPPTTQPAPSLPVLPGTSPASAEPKAQQLAAAQQSLAPAAMPAAENTYSVTFHFPTRYRNMRILVDGRPALVTDQQLSQVKLRVPRKAGTTHFTIQSDLLSKPREFDLLINRDNYEHSPFQ